MNNNELSGLLQGQNPNLTPQLPAGLSTLLSVASIALTLLSLVIIILSIASLIRRWKVQTAIFDIQKQVREINQREQAKQSPPPEQQKMPSMDPIDSAQTKEPQENI